MNPIDSTVLIINNVPQYFFDNGVIEQVQDLTKTIHSPAKEPGPIIKKDRPWERVAYFTVNGSSVLRDPESGEFKCWYENWHVDTKEVARLGYLPCCFSSTCYAVSKDGVNWEKPDMDYYKADGQKTNVVVGNEDYIKLESTFVFYDSLETDPNKRYKMMVDHYITERSLQEVANNILSTRDSRDGLTDMVQVEMLCSPDGIHWTPAEDTPRFGKHGNGLGDCYTITPDEDCGIYRLYTRAAGMESVHYDPRRPKTNSFFPPHFPNNEARMNKRRVFLSQSSDLVHWSRPECILTPNAQEDNLDTSYYGMVQFKIGEIQVGLLNVLSQVSNTINVHLVYSRDGLRWHHMDRRQPWLATSSGQWDEFMVSISTAPIPVDDELFVFHGGANNHHDWWITGLKEGLDTPEAEPSLENVNYGLGLAKMRLDGFVSVDAHKIREGVMVTRVLRTNSKKLELNVACNKGGYVDIEVTDVDENVLKGFSRADCDTFTGNSVKTTITWKGKSEIPHNDCLRLRFFMRNAALYSFRFC